MPIQTAIDSISNSQGSPFGFKNRIINGAMVIDQRNAGASVSIINAVGYTVDRFYGIQAIATSKFTVQQSSTVPTGFTKSVVLTSSSAYTVLSSDYFLYRQTIEGFNVADLGWGTANAQTVTLSFWVRSSLTGTFGGSFSNGDSNRSYPFSYTINAANTFEQKTITIVGDTTGTWATDNSGGIVVNWSLGMGSTYEGTVNVWAGTFYGAPTGAVDLVATNGATLYITGVQLEKGSQATAFDYRPYGAELQLCQRYFEMSYPQGTAPGTATQQTTALSVYNNSSVASTGATMTIPVRFKASKRVSPTVTIYQPITGATGFMRNYDTGATITSSVFLPSQEQCSLVTLDGTNGCTQNQPLVGHFTASAEL
jgi:hypothetical protein